MQWNPCQIKWNLHLGGGNSNIFNFHPEPWGRFPIWRAYFSKGLKPTTRKVNQGWLNCKPFWRYEIRYVYAFCYIWGIFPLLLMATGNPIPNHLGCFWNLVNNGSPSTGEFAGSLGGNSFLGGDFHPGNLERWSKIQFDLRIFFKWVGKNHQLITSWSLYSGWNRYSIYPPRPQDSVGKWRFSLGFPILKNGMYCNNPCGEYHFEARLLGGFQTNDPYKAFGCFQK